jgi:hypothetical protein
MSECPNRSFAVQGMKHNKEAQRNDASAGEINLVGPLAVVDVLSRQRQDPWCIVTRRQWLRGQQTMTAAKTL